MEKATGSGEKASFYRASILPELLVFQASYRKFQFARHFHDEFALGVMESGVQKIFCHGRDYFAPTGSLITVNPGDIHDGCSGDGASYKYRILYIPMELMQEAGSVGSGKNREIFFRTPVTHDPAFAIQLRRLHCMLDEPSWKDLKTQPFMPFGYRQSNKNQASAEKFSTVEFSGKKESLEVQTFFYSLLLTFISRHGIEKNDWRKEQVFPYSVMRATEFINDNSEKKLSLDDIAAAAGLSRFHFLRVFKNATGMSPYAYLLHRRLQLAKEGIKKKKSLADAAIDAGFADQSHLSRRFKAAYGITLNQYRKTVC
ncbi:AraC family transcriptional regulator [Desulfomarina profundi]|uniref:AraC family transcriptional regulator n=1 Tax=Desulfomarina profundi TaxID=2772557 RepID=A0A8D5JJ01_9BACT|nr:AraC family transcriptional regulator [Desulfomarina profundi]BCL63244.1 AraC family transcriptional regulator [Desulfomarina profundi]